MKPQLSSSSPPLSKRSAPLQKERKKKKPWKHLQVKFSKEFETQFLKPLTKLWLWLLLIIKLKPELTQWGFCFNFMSSVFLHPCQRFNNAVMLSLEEGADESSFTVSHPLQTGNESTLSTEIRNRKVLSRTPTHSLLTSSFRCHPQLIHLAVRRLVPGSHNA